MIYKKTVKAFCKDFTKIENYEKAMADSETWVCHHRLELDSIVPISKQELIGLGLYYNRPAEELIFLTKAEHTSLHHKDKYISKETKNKISETLKRKNLYKGRHWKLVEGRRVWI